MSCEHLQQQIDALKDEVRRLRHEIITGPPRLGPRTGEPTADQIAKAVRRLADGIKPAVDPPAVDRSNVCTTNGQSVADVRAGQTNDTGQHAGYIVLCDEERAKGFVRPYRDAYKHVGLRPTYPLADLTPEQHELGDRFGYVKFEAYPDGSPESNGGSTTGRYWTAADMRSGCGGVTTMGRALSETYARDPKFYGATFCVTCNRHLPVGEFVWTEDGAVVGS